MNMIVSISATMFYLSMMSVISRENFDGEVSYDRIDEVNRECSFMLDSATELQRDDNRLNTVKSDLSFENGDWWQDSNAAPLMPFDGSDPRSPLKLISFSVTDVNSRYRSNKAIYVRSFLRMGITLWRSFSAEYYGGKPIFNISPGHSQLSVSFQGIYAESEENHGERVMCLLGTTFWPSNQLNSSLDEPLVDKDDKILLVLRFPKTLTLRSMPIRGIMKSMNSKSNLRYFDEVQISSWMRKSVNYEFASETLVSRACETYPFEDRFVSGDIDLYKGLNFCDLLKRSTENVPFTILSNWKCNGTDDYCSKIGPFVLDKEINTRDFKLLIQDVRCDGMTFQDDGKSISTMKVFVVLRAVPPYEDEFVAGQRTGVSNLTIFAEGIWKSSSGQLCMLGCKGGGNQCDTRICLYLPLSFSLNRQTLILGTLSSIDHASTSDFYPLPFERQAPAAMHSQAIFWKQYIHPRPTYEYSKIADARVIFQKDKPLSLCNVLKKSLLGFPKIMDLQQFPYSLSALANDLSFPHLHISETDVALNIYFLGPLFGRCFSRQDISSFAKENHYYFDMNTYADKNLLLNVSGQLNNVPNLHTSSSFLSVEGIYDPLVGKMYLIGCQDPSDCSVEVVISYPPTTARWLFKPRAWVFITSKHKKDDPFYFRPIKLQTGPLTYQGSEDTLSRKGLEGILSILILSFGVTCILRQLYYIRESAPYVSHVMLAVQAFGYSLPLFTGAQVIFKKMESDSYWQTSQWIRISEYVVKLLVLAAFLLTIKLFHKVWKSRVRMVRLTSLEPEHVPNETKVCLATLVMHIIGCILYLRVHSAKSASESPQSAPAHESGTDSDRIILFLGEVKEYLVLVQDLFLVPQIIANLLWKIDCKPLRRFYYVGMTFVRLFPHIYYLVKPGYFPEPYSLYRPQFDLFSMVEDVALAVTVVFLGFVVYAQQRWSYETLRQACFGECSKFKSV